MNIFLTFDYELFFGEKTGTVEKCMIEPTNKLLQMARKYSIPMTFFVDVGYLVRLETESAKHFNLKSDLTKVKNQITEMIECGCDVQLHIHPHWERSYYNGEKWVIEVDGCYKLADFEEYELVHIVTFYKDYLEEISRKKVHTFRAGGWCIQPFNRLKDLFKDVGIKYDTSVFPGGNFESKHYSFDFRSAPRKSSYRFEDDVCEEVETGSFTEYPISSMLYSPFFYWRLYILGRLFPRNHKMVGDGVFLSQPGRKKSVLTNYTWNHVSSDGYYASKLKIVLRKMIKESFTDMVIIGHPKSLTLFSIEVLETFVKKSYLTHNFRSFRELP
jgi:hypothetical protein